MTPEELGYSHARQLPDGRFAGITPLTFGRARLCVWVDEWNVLDAW